MSTNKIEITLAKFFFKIQAKGRKKLWYKISKMLKNGVPIIDALESIYKRRLLTHGGHDFTVLAIGDWIKKMHNGMRFSKAIEEWVPQDEHMLISAGDQSGKLSESLIFSTEVMQSKSEIRSAVVSGLMYPTVLTLLALGVLIMFSYKVIPEFAKVVPNGKWTGLAGTVVNFSGFVQEWILVIIIGIIALIVLFSLSLSRWSGGLRVKLDSYLPYNIYRFVQGSIWMISLAALVSAGVRIETALEQIASKGSKWLRDRTKACLSGMRSGYNIGDALAKSGYGFPDLEIINDLDIYSRLSGFDVAIGILGKELIEDSVQKIKGLMQVLFSISLIIAAILIGFMVGGLFSMETQMTSAMQNSFN